MSSRNRWTAEYSVTDSVHKHIFLHTHTHTHAVAAHTHTHLSAHIPLADTLHVSYTLTLSDPVSSTDHQSSPASILQLLPTALSSSLSYSVFLFLLRPEDSNWIRSLTRREKRTGKERRGHRKGKEILLYFGVTNTSSLISTNLFPAALFSQNPLGNLLLILLIFSSSLEL